MIKDSDHPIKNNCLSSGFLKFKGLYKFHDGVNGEIKEGKDMDKNSNQAKQLSETKLQKNISSSLIQFMENQDKKHLSTYFNHKDVQKFLKEKEKAMEEIIIEDDLMDEKNENGNEDKDDKSKPKIKDKNKSLEFQKENDEYKRKNINSNENSNILIFHGTFGEDKCNEIMKTQHHHRHSHHHHHHHHHPDNQKTENLNENEDKRKLAFKC